jgi:hypothetical protein
VQHAIGLVASLTAPQNSIDVSPALVVEPVVRPLDSIEDCR